MGLFHSIHAVILIWTGITLEDAQKGANVVLPALIGESDRSTSPTEMDMLILMTQKSDRGLRLSGWLLLL